VAQLISVTLDNSKIYDYTGQFSSLRQNLTELR